jgi:hypothetical protein
VFLEHALLISDIMVAVELACRHRKDVGLLTADDLHLPKMREPFQWQVNIGVKCGVIPDRVFGLEYKGQRCWYFLEADRATMPIMRGNLDQTSFYRKLLAYETTWTRNACQKLNQGRGIFLFTDTKSLRECPDFFSLRWHTHRENEPVGLLD